ncbi:23S rRNA (guanosine-2'-O-)-methyltransferase RlmB [Gammaproteobacteria bacterium]
MIRERLTYGVHAVLAAVAQGSARVLWLDAKRQDTRLRALREAATAAGLPCNEVDRKVLEEMLPEVRHQGVIARCIGSKPLAEEDLSSFLEALQVVPFLLILDGIQDPHNLGACLRTADAAGVQAVIAPKDRAAGMSPTVHKTSSGASETVPFFQVTNLARTLDLLKKLGIWIVGTTDQTSQFIYRVDLTVPLALVIGAEGTGIRRLTAEKCDLLAKLPMLGSVENLNASVAAGVCLFEALRQRQFG